MYDLYTVEALATLPPGILPAKILSDCEMI